MVDYFIAETSEIIAQGNVCYGGKGGMSEATEIDINVIYFVIVFIFKLQTYRTIFSGCSFLKHCGIYCWSTV